MTNGDKKLIVTGIFVMLVLVTLVAYWQACGNGFCWDDGLYITENEHIRTGLTWENIRGAFTASHGATWHPLTSLSHMLDCQLFELEAFWHHLTSLLFHIFNVLLLFWILKRATGELWLSAFIATVFALHPLNVESVAWVAERKNVLSTFFWMLTIIAYIRYSEHPGIGRYLQVILFFSLGLMAKPMVVTLPFVLLLLDYWPLSRFQFGQKSRIEDLSRDESAILEHRSSSVRRLVAEKVPLFALSAVVSVITFITQRGRGAVKSIPVESRIANAVVSYGRYIGKTLWPSKLAAFYPFPRSLEAGPLAGWAFFLLCVSILVLIWWRRRPWLLVGWLWYIGTLIPVIGLVQVGGQAMADRYVYVPMIGLLIIFGWSAREVAARWPITKTGIGICAVIVLVALTLCTRIQTGYWRNNITLYERALKVTAGNALLHDNLGREFSIQGELDKAIEHYKAALRFNPRYYAAYYDLAAILIHKGRTDEAIEHLKEAVKFKPEGPKIRNMLASAYFQQGDYEPAVMHWSEALRLRPDWAEVLNNLAWLKSAYEDVPFYDPNEAVEMARRACEMTENKRYQMLDTLGVAYAAAGRFEQAVRTAEQALELARSSGRPESGVEISKHLELYKAGRPYRGAIQPKSSAVQ